MSFAEFTHNPTTVDAIEVKRPWIHVQNQVPFASQVKTGAGAFSWFRIASAGSLTVQRAHEGDWILKHGNGIYSVMNAEDFQRNYGTVEAPQDPPPF